MRAHYKIGTRGSLLALTQCTQVKNELERITGDVFELEIIKTQGDMITNAPLWQLDGKDFFTRELDQALLEGKVDLVVHSYKDLGSVRPEGIELAAITKRSYAHDVLLIKKSTITKLQNGDESLKTFVIGTSSPRRMHNLKNHFKNYLPSTIVEAVETKVLRGNVNTRVQKLVDDEFHAVVLALPGLERLSLSDESKKVLTELIKDLTFMVLPQTEFPSAAAQGALAIECLKNRTDGGALLQKLKKMEDHTTREEVTREREAFKNYGGGCHLAVGIHVEKKKEFFCHYHRGFHDNQEIDLQKLEESEFKRNFPQFFTAPKVFVGFNEKKATRFKHLYPHLVFDKYLTKQALPLTSLFGEHLYVTSKYCYHALDLITQNKDMKKFIFAAGTKTMRELAALGFWVHGTSDSLGDEELKRLRDSKFLSLFYGKNHALEVLSHDKSKSTLAEVTPVYTHLTHELNDDYKKTLLETEIFYWTSATQFHYFVDLVPEIKNKHHAVGLGKTYDELKKIDGLKLLPFLSMKEFEQYLRTLK